VIVTANVVWQLSHSQWQWQFAATSEGHKYLLFEANTFVHENDLQNIL